MSLAVITVTELATWSIGVTIAVGETTTSCGLPAVPDCWASGGACCAVGTTRRDAEAGWEAGFDAVLLLSAGASTSMLGSRLGDADCCALAAEIPKERTGTRKLEAYRQVRRRWAAVAMEDMVRPRYDVSGTSQRTKSHPLCSAHPW